jgi:hypothetical protein
LSQTSLKELADRLSPALRRVLAAMPWGGRRLLVIGLGDLAARALVLTKGAAGPEVVRFAETTFDTSMRNMRTRLARIMEALGPDPARQVLVVLPEVRFLAAELSVPPRRRFRAATPLTEEARWEIAPFLDFPSERALVRVALAPRDDEAYPADVPDSGETPRQPAFIFALDRHIHAGLKGACREHKKRLLGVLPEEAFAWAMAGPTARETAVLIDWRLHDIQGALIRDGQPRRVLREPVQAGEVPRDVLARLTDELLLEDGGNENIVIGGPQAEQIDPETLLADGNGPPVRTWDSEQDLLFASSPGPLPARYLGLLGAAAVVGMGGRKAASALIDDRKPLPVRIREHVHTLPLILLGLLGLGLGGEYLYMKQQVYRLEHDTVELSAKKKTLEKAVAGEERLKKRFQDLKDNQYQLRRKSDLLSGGLAQRRDRLLRLLGELTVRVPGDIRLTRFRQFSDRVYFVEGVTAHYPAITECVVRLKGSPLIEKCQLEKSSRQGDERTPSYDFTIRLRLEKRHG